MKHLKVKQFSELTGVTVRTLHHYDRIGLLQPKLKTESGYRLYTEEDMLRLQQILTLKFLGLTLSQIQALIDTEDKGLLEILTLQYDALLNRSKETQYAVKILKDIVDELKQTKSIHWEKQLELIKVMKMTDQAMEKWCEENLSNEEMKRMKQLSAQFTPEFLEKYEKKWDTMFEQFNQIKHEDPRGEAAQVLAKQAYALITEVWDGNMDISKKLWDATKKGETPNRDKIKADDETLEFYNEAIYFYISNLKKS